MALNVAATTIVYLWASTYFIGKQSEPQRRAQGLARKEHQLMFDTVGGWSSVSYFNRQAYEQERYSQAVGSCPFSDTALRTLELIIVPCRAGDVVATQDRPYVLSRIRSTRYNY